MNPYVSPTAYAVRSENVSDSTYEDRLGVALLVSLAAILGDLAACAGWITLIGTPGPLAVIPFCAFSMGAGAAAAVAALWVLRKREVS